MSLKNILIAFAAMFLFSGMAHAQTATRPDGTQTVVNPICPKAPKVARGTELEQVFVTGSDGTRSCVWSTKAYVQPKKHEGWLAGAGRCMLVVETDYQTCINGGPIIVNQPSGYYGNGYSGSYYGQRTYTTSYQCSGRPGDPNCGRVPAPAPRSYGYRY